MLPFTLRLSRCLALAAIFMVIFIVQQKWSVLEQFTVSTHPLEGGQSQDQHAPVAIPEYDQTLSPPQVADPDHVPEEDAITHLDRVLASNKSDVDRVLELDSDPEVHRALNRFRESKLDRNLRLDQEKSVRHFKQLKPLDVDLDLLRKQEPHHYPPWNDYKKADYNPNRWHFFPLEERFFQCTIHDSPVSPLNQSELYKPDTVNGSFVSCLGPRGLRLNESTEDSVYAYKHSWDKFPQPLFGSHNALGLNDSVCFTRESRYRAYGLGTTSDPASVIKPNVTEDLVDWNAVSWGSLQDRCYAENKDALATSTAANRSAILIRAWDSYKYQVNDLHAIRSLVAEAALHGHGEYQVFLFVQVKNMSIPIWEDAAVYQSTLEASVPAEFRDMTILWNEGVCQRLYPKVGDNSVYWQQWQPIQWFSREHPEFEFVWNWEMDARYIGHHFDFLNTVSNWAARQPRKYLWERSSRFFMQSVHQSWHKFFDWISIVVPPHVATWGPRPAIDTSSKDFTIPPTIITDDNFEFGAGEAADLISFLPFFDPENTLWAYRDKIFNYVQGRTTPRRVYINTLSRLSRKLLTSMHEENTAGLSMVSEMWPASVALHFGLKAVHAPHPVWTSHVWPQEYANEVFNIGPAAAPDTDRDAPYSPDREHYFGSISFYFWSHLPGTLYRRWLGWNVQDEHGDIQNWEAKPYEHMCLPSMLLHPVKAASFEKRGDYRP